jgi:hypothetical protein
MAYKTFTDSFTLSETFNLNVGESIVFKLVQLSTTTNDFNTMNNKFMHNMSVVGDQQTGDSLSVYWSDDDYQTWSNPKVLSRAGRSFFTRCGVFRRRAFRINHTGNYDLRLESIEAELDLGFS